MKKQSSISVYIKEEEMKTIVSAGTMVGLNNSAFCRNAALERANSILKQNKEAIPTA